MDNEILKNLLCSLIVPSLKKVSVYSAKENIPKNGEEQADCSVFAAMNVEKPLMPSPELHRPICEKKEEWLNMATALKEGLSIKKTAAKCNTAIFVTFEICAILRQNCHFGQRSVYSFS